MPIARSQDTAGPIARNVRDAALLLRTIEEPGARPLRMHGRRCSHGQAPADRPVSGLSPACASVSCATTPAPATIPS